MAVRSLNVPAPAEAAPIVTPSIAPPLMSTLESVATPVIVTESIYPTPSTYKSLNFNEDVPMSISSSVTGTIAPSCILSCSTADPLTSLKKPILLLLVSITTLFSASLSAIKGTYAPSVELPSCLCPPDKANASRKALYSAITGAA